MKLYTKTDKERSKEYQDFIKEKSQWHKAYAWLPTTICDGVVVWLEEYEQRLVEDRLFLPYWETKAIWGSKE